MSEKLPNWNLESIYPSIDCDELNNDFAAYEAACSFINENLEKSSLKELLERLNEVYELSSNLSSYAGCRFSTDCTSEENLKLQARVDELFLIGDECEKRFYQELVNRKAEIESEELEEYRYILNEMLDGTKHLMSLKEEVLASDLLRSGGDAFGRLQDSLCASIEKEGETLIALRAKAMDSDREVRKEAFIKEKALLKEHEIAYSFALNGVKGTVLTLEKKRGWASPLEHSASVARISMEGLNTLIKVLEKNLPFWRDYLNTKAKLLGLEKMSFYDLFAPVGKSEKTYTFEEAKELVVGCYSAFNPKMGEFAKKAFENNWIDAPICKGKVGGAYDTSFYKSKESRVLCNFDGSYESVSTLAHELGHAYHDSVVMKKPMLLGNYTMPVAETASIFGETLLFNYCFDKMSKEEQLAVLESTLSSGCQVCVDILSRFYFERSAFEERKSGDVTPQKFCSLMLKAQEDTYGDALEEKHEYMWAVKSHYYSTGFSFYNYPYAFGQLFALSLYHANITPSEYIKVLENTGCMSVDDCAKAAGFDITDEAFWQAGVDVMKHYLDLMKQCM